MSRPRDTIREELQRRYAHRSRVTRRDPGHRPYHIDEREIEESLVRSSGPGGQNVNKLATAVQLRFDVRGSPSLPAEVPGAS